RFKSEQPLRVDRGLVVRLRPQAASLLIARAAALDIVKSSSRRGYAAYANLHGVGARTMNGQRSVEEHIDGVRDLILDGPIRGVAQRFIGGFAIRSQQDVDFLLWRTKHLPLASLDGGRSFQR